MDTRVVVNLCMRENDCAVLPGEIISCRLIGIGSCCRLGDKDIAVLVSLTQLVTEQDLLLPHDVLLLVVRRDHWRFARGQSYPNISRVEEHGWVVARTFSSSRVVSDPRPLPSGKNNSPSCGK